MTDPCAPWLRQLLGTEVDWLGFNPQRAAVPRLRNRAEELRATRMRLDDALRPGKPGMLSAQLGRMAIHYHATLPKVSEQGLTELYDDYLTALGHFPYDIFKAACTEYRDRGRFWPKISELKELMDGPYHARQWDWKRVNLLCVALEQPDPISSP